MASARFDSVLLSLCIFTIPMATPIHNTALIVYAAYLVLQFYQRRATINRQLISAVILLTGFFWLSLIYLTFAANTGYLLSQIETRLTILLWPLLILLNSNTSFNPEERKLKLLVFVYAVVCCCVYCHFVMVSDLVNRGFPFLKLFTFYEYQTSYLSSPLNIHPTYLSLFIIIAVVSLMYFLHTFSRLGKVFAVVGVFYLTGFLILLFARGPLVAFFVIVLAGLIRMGFVQRQYKKAGLLLIYIAIVIFISHTYLENFRYKFITTVSSFLEDQSTGTGDSKNSISLHFRSWECSLELIREYPLWGVGSDARDFLNSCYRSRGWDSMAEENLNSHSQFLTYQVEFGLLGTVLFLAQLLFLTYTAIRNRDLLFMILIASCLICFIPESILERQKGLTFFFCFSSLFIKIRPHQAVGNQNH